ncbi:MAG TPA: MarR family winged helix-turn-helix transcriptional regulator [Ornithinibacter sp.]|nr:MarR family winged helix-turn-helix transcriptional regulator [Ornithinibacter sp.]
MASSPWLSPEEQHLWRSWLALTSALPAALHRELQADAGLSLPDFDVLVRLSESHDGRLRVSELARVLGWERSRLSHHVARMERRDLVGHEDCPDDGRGAFVVLTPTGRRAIEDAAPHHVRTVRRLVLDPLDGRDLADLSRIVTTLLARVTENAPGAGAPGAGGEPGASP